MLDLRTASKFGMFTFPRQALASFCLEVVESLWGGFRTLWEVVGGCLGGLGSCVFVFSPCGEVVGRLWEVVGGCGRLWEVQGGLCEVLGGYGRFWEVVGGCGRL